MKYVLTLVMSDEEHALTGDADGTYNASSISYLKVNARFYPLGGI